MLGHVGLREVRAFLVDLTLGPHDDAGNAKATLQTAAGGECFGVPIAFFLVDTFESDDRLSGHLGERLLTTDDRLSVDHHRATSALTRRGAAVLGRGDVEFLSKSGQKMRVIVANLNGATVYVQRNHRHGIHHHPPISLGGRTAPRWPVIRV